MRSSVITNEDSKKHFVENYRFRVLSHEKRVDEKGEAENLERDLSQNLSENLHSDEFELNFTEPSTLHTPISQDHALQSNFTEELLKRVDDLSGSIIKLQMQIESQESEFERRLEAEVARAREDGLQEGEALARANFQQSLKELETRYASSMAKLEKEAEKFGNFLTSAEEELSNTAIDIAKEIVKKEISSNSSSVAYALSKSLLKELAEAKNIQIRVSNKDFEFLKQNFTDHQNIQISADEAINTGGVIIMSDAGNIDGSIESRFEKIKRLLVNENG